MTSGWLTPGRRRATCSCVAAIGLLLEIYSWIVLIAVLSSWIPSDNVVFRVANQMTEPVLEPIRKVIPPAGGFDLSPLILLLGVHLLRAFFH